MPRDPNHLTGHDRIGKKPSHATVPLKVFGHAKN
jgi:hypothetical protein